MTFEPLTIETAPEASRPLVAASTRQLGFLPDPVARAARSPALLAHLLAGFPAFDRSSLAPIEREVVAMTVGFHQGCDYCMAMHSALLAADPAHAPLVAALRAGAHLPDARLEALRAFTLAVIVDRGRIPADTWAAFTSAGFTEAQALDVVLGAGVYLLSTLSNIVTGSQLDPPFAAHRWSRPEAAAE